MNAGPMGEPLNPWMMETGSIIFWCVLAAISVVLTLRYKRLLLMPLLLIAATSGFWQEFFGDWGAYVAWNPHFARLPFWGEMAFTTPVKPLFIPFSWGWWFAISLSALVMVVRFVHAKVPAISTTVAAFVIALPLFTLYQIYVEGTSVANGWWTYDVVIGPSLQSPKGRLPLIFDVELAFWAALVIALVAARDARGFFWHERKLGVDTIAPGFKREAARAGAFMLMFQVTMFAINIAPAIIGRLLFGGPSLLVP